MVRQETTTWCHWAPWHRADSEDPNCGWHGRKRPRDAIEHPGIAQILKTLTVDGTAGNDHMMPLSTLASRRFWRPSPWMARQEPTTWCHWRPWHRADSEDPNRGWHGRSRPRDAIEDPGIAQILKTLTVDSTAGADHVMPLRTLASRRFWRP